MRCTCPHYSIPSADPNDSRGCPQHDPNYVDYESEYRALRLAVLDALIVGREPLDSMRGTKRQLRERGQGMIDILNEAL